MRRLNAFAAGVSFMAMLGSARDGNLGFCIANGLFFAANTFLAVRDEQ